jgi:hypothetical protein
MSNYHRQVRLKKNNTICQAWIPEKFAKKGKVIKLKNEDGWIVTDVYFRMESTLVNDNSQDYKSHRKATDI